MFKINKLIYKIILKNIDIYNGFDLISIEKKQISNINFVLVSFAEILFILLGAKWVLSYFPVQSCSI